MDKFKELKIIREDIKNRFNKSFDDYILLTFEQLWGSTALGFSGMCGGDAMTWANTYILREKDGDLCHIYFSDEYAYSTNWCSNLERDIQTRTVASIGERSRYII